MSKMNITIPAHQAHRIEQLAERLIAECGGIPGLARTRRADVVRLVLHRGCEALSAELDAITEAAQAA